MRYDVNDLELIAPAYGSDVPEFEMASFCDHHAECSCLLVSNRTVDLPHNGRLIVYPRRLQPFSFTSTINFGLRNSDARVKIVTGIDWWFSTEQLAAASTIEDDVVMLFGIRRDFKSCIRDWPNRGRHQRYVDCPDYNRGTWAMTANTWNRFRGMDERYCLGWGCEDAEMEQRIQEAGVKIIIGPGLVVVDHTTVRSWRYSPTKKAGHAAHKKLLKSPERWHNLTESENWGCGLVGDGQRL